MPFEPWKPFDWARTRGDGSPASVSGISAEAAEEGRRARRGREGTHFWRGGDDADVGLALDDGLLVRPVQRKVAAREVDERPRPAVVVVGGLAPAGLLVGEALDRPPDSGHPALLLRDPQHARLEHRPDARVSVDASPDPVARPARPRLLERGQRRLGVRVKTPRIDRRVWPVEHPRLALCAGPRAHSRRQPRRQVGRGRVGGGRGWEEDVRVGCVQPEQVGQVRRQVERVAEVKVAVLARRKVVLGQVGPAGREEGVGNGGQSARARRGRASIGRGRTPR